MENVHLLISRYLDGELSDEEFAGLAAALETDVASVDYLVFTSFIHAQLLNWMDQQTEHAREGAASIDGADLGSDRRTGAFPSPGILDKVQMRGQPSDAGQRRNRVLSFGSLAAALFVAASLLIVGYVVRSRPEIVGQLTESTNCTWGASAAGIGVGTLLPRGQELELIRGKAIITFASGAKVFLEGPTSLRLDSPKSIRLASGRVAAKVPRQAVGFTVDSSLARFVDLGTAFTLSLRAEKSFELHVFEGLVELQLDERFGKAVRHPVRVAEIHAMSFDVATGDVETLEFEPGKTMPF